MLSAIFKVSPHKHTLRQKLTVIPPPPTPLSLSNRDNLLLLDPGLLFIYPSGRTPASPGACLCLHCGHGIIQRGRDTWICVVFCICVRLEMCARTADGGSDSVLSRQKRRETNGGKQTKDNEYGSKRGIKPEKRPAEIFSGRRRYSRPFSKSMNTTTQYSNTNPKSKNTL